MAFIDSRTLRSDHVIESDLCVIGAGAAGLAIANRFLGGSKKVALLESGGMELESPTQSLYRGNSVGQLHAALDQSRLRFFGGTTNHWTAHVRPLDPIDFEERAWVPHSGWPFSRADLDPYYQRATRYLGLPVEAFDPESVESEERKPPRFEDGKLEHRIRRVLPMTRRRLGELEKDALAGSKNVDVYLHANTLRIELDPAKRRVTGLSLGALDGLRFGARAKRYVLAAGGIENPRILLLSSIESSGLVGAFYANHPEYWAGYLMSGERGSAWSWSRPRPHENGMVIDHLVVAAAVQRAAKILNAAINFPHVKPGMLGRLLKARLPGAPRDNKVSFRNRDVVNLARALTVSSEREAAGGPGASSPPIGLQLFGEPVPQRDSRVRLGARRDALGLQRAELDWRLADADLRSARETLRIAAQAIGAGDLGRARILLPEDGIAALDLTGSHHHMGTTRMHRDPKRGVVDPDCRLHGVENLFVAGSSVFPTYGAVNPTLTIIALAFRLADHLKARL